MEEEGANNNNNNNNNSPPPEDPNHLKLENHDFQPSPSETESEEKPKTWADRRNQIKTYFVKRCKYLWKHRVGVAIIVCLLALCLFPVWIAYTYVLEDRKLFILYFLIFFNFNRDLP